MDNNQVVQITTKRPIILPGDSAPYVYFNGNFYWGIHGAIHRDILEYLVKQGIDHSSLVEDGVWGYVRNEGEDEDDPRYIDEAWSDFYGPAETRNNAAEAAQKLDALFHGIRHQSDDSYEAYASTKWARRAILSSMSLDNLDDLIGQDDAAQTAISALNNAGGQVYVVGGAVRDAAMGKMPKDIDLMVAGLDDQQIEDALNPLGRVDYTGKNFGVYRFRKGNDEVEIALPRTEVSTGSGHRDFDVTADPNLDPADDLGRRDFTVNAMAYDPVNQKLLDPYGGMNDLQNGTLSLVNDNALREDPLRIVRALVSYSKSGLEPDPQLLHAMEENAQAIRALPGERIQMEMDKLLSGNDPAGAMEIAEQTGLLDYIAPELSASVGFDQKNPHHDLNVFEHTMAVLRAMSQLSNDPDMRLAALFHDSGKPDSFWLDPNAPEGGGGHFYQGTLDDGTEVGADHEDVGSDLVRAFMTRLRYPNDRISRVTTLVQNHMWKYYNSARGARKFLASLGGNTKMAFDELTLRQADAMGKRDGTMSDFDRESLDRARQLLQQVIEQSEATTVKDLAINGRDLLAIGMHPGPEIGVVLNKLLNEVVENPELNNRDDLMRMIQDGR